MFERLHAPAAASRGVEGSVLRLVATAALAFLALGTILFELPRVVPEHGLWDFGSFVASARAAAQGLDPYGIHPLTLHVSLPGFATWNPNLNPPISILLFQPFDWAPPQTTLRVWWWLSVLAYAAAVILLLRRYAEGIEAALLGVCAFGLAGFWDTLFLGQIYLPLVLGAVGAWLLLEQGRLVWAGLLIGVIVAIKPNFLVWPVLLFLAGYRLPALVSVAVAAAISAVPLVVFGPDIYWRWLTLVAGDGERAAFPTNASLAAFAARLDLPALGRIVSIGGLLALAAWAWWCRPSIERASAFGLLAAVLASPLGWIHYTLFLLPVLMAYRRHWPSAIVTALLLVPVPFVIGQLGTPLVLQLTLGSVYGWALLSALAMLVALEVRRLHPTGPAVAV